MQLADGELDVAREDELTKELSDDARDKLAALALTGELIAEEAHEDTRADGLAELIMAKIERDELPELEARDLPKFKMSVPSGAPANDNARRIFVLAAMAAAVAAGLMVWGRADPGTEVATQRREPTPMAASPSPSPSQVAALEPVVDDSVPVGEPGVEVAAVDFGESSGAVFYIDGAPNEPRTTVVWVTDESGDD